MDRYAIKCYLYLNVQNSITVEQIEGMTVRQLFQITLLFFWIVLIPGCSSHPGFLRSHQDNDSPDKSDITEAVSLDEDTTLSEAGVISPINLTELTVIQKLDSTAKYLDNANQLMNEEQFMPAGYWFALARVTVAEIKKSEVGKYQAFYDELVTEVENFYTLYVAGVEVLPLESPREAILAAIDEAEIDSNESGEAEGDSLDLGSLLDRPEVVIDSTELKALLNTQERLPDVPLELNRKVNNAISFFQGKGRKVFTKWLERGETFVPILLPILQEEGLPDNLVFLAMIESGFNPKAYSYAHAAGPWQFISSTGKIFGLDVGWWYDERRDPTKSTHAAAMYLKKLYADFDDWYLALASYNCGEGKVKRHVRKYGTRDFWKLSKLPRQTRNYVPTYIAATIIANDPEKYGFKPMQFKPAPSRDSVLVSECVDLQALAKLAGIRESDLRTENPAIVRWCTPPDRDNTWVYLPAGDYDGLAEKVTALPPDQRRKFIRHTIRNGEALSTIARKYGTTVHTICSIKENKIRNRNRIRAGKVLMIPVPSDGYRASASPASNYSSPPPSDRKKTSYKVRKGDNLSTIAKRFGTSVSALRSWNKLYNKKFIYPGQSLTVWVKPTKKSTIAASKFQGPMPKHHVVQDGDTAWDIARYYRVDMDELLKLNDLGRRSKIKPGQKLQLPEPALVSVNKPQPEKVTVKSDLRKHIVRKRDTLWDIAKKYDVSIASIKKENGLRTSKIKPGQELIIPSS